MNRKAKPKTLAAQALGWIDPQTKEIIAPVHLSTTYIRDADNQYTSGLVYSRTDNPTYLQPEALLANLEQGAGALLFSSGMAAATAVFQSLKPGGHVVAPKVMYWSLKSLANRHGQRLGTRGRSGGHERSGRT